MSALVPADVDGFADVPHTIHDAVRVALVFLSWEELPKNEQPPKAIWMDPDRREAWFKEVERNREARMRGEEGADPGQVQKNTLADELIA